MMAQSRAFPADAMGHLPFKTYLFLPQLSASHNRSACLASLGPGDDGVRLAASPRRSALRTRCSAPAAAVVGLALGVPPSPPAPAGPALALPHGRARPRRGGAGVAVGATAGGAPACRRRRTSSAPLRYTVTTTSAAPSYTAQCLVFP